MKFTEKLNEYISLVDKGLDLYLPKEEDYPEILSKAMRYSVFAGGKRLRPVIILASCEAFGGDLEKALPFACSMEMIHTYSLIHDDLPAMDNDDYRRGRLTNHKVFGEDMAILAGDGLLSLAFEVMTDAVSENPESIGAMAEIVKGAGVYGMVGGQAADVISEGEKIDEKTLDFIHRNKTGAMIKASFTSGGILGNARKADIERLAEIGSKIGLGFQVQDDILDVTGTLESLGKPIKSDEKNQKTTYVSMYGLDKSKEIAENSFKDAEEIASELSGNIRFLVWLIRFISGREN